MSADRKPVDPDVETKVVRRMYQQVIDLDWAAMSQADRTKKYNEWTENSSIGGHLLPFLITEQAVRVWLKDGPIKEYPRAVYGYGKYGKLLSRPAISIPVLVDKAMGAGWIVADDSFIVKPLRVTLRHHDDESQERRFAWGPAKDVKHLVWGALKAELKGDQLPWVICLTESFTHPIPDSDRTFNMDLGKRVGINIIHIMEG